MNKLDLIGVWSTSPVSDGCMCDIIICFLADGKGYVAEANCSPYFAYEMEWNIENEELIIQENSKIKYKQLIEYNPCVEIMDINGAKYKMQSIKGVYDFTYYMPITDKEIKLDDKVKEIENLVKDFIFD